MLINLRRVYILDCIIFYFTLFNNIIFNMANKKTKPVTAGPSLFGDEVIEEVENFTVKTVVHEVIVPQKNKKYDCSKLGINADYEKYGEIHLLKNKLP